MKTTVVKTEQTAIRNPRDTGYVTATRFYVSSTPCWLARLFGSEERIVTVVWHDGKFYEEDSRSTSLEEKTAVLRSLLPRPLPEARLLPRGETDE